MKRSILAAICFSMTTTLTAQPVQTVPSAPQLLIPAAGSTPGVNGTFFHTDVALVNFANHNQSIQVQWLPQGGGGASIVTMTLFAQGFFRDADFVRDNLKQSGLGAIVISGITAAGAIDPTASLYATVRIWTQQPGTNGTTSQSFPAIPLASVNTPGPAALFALGGDTNNYRVNIGIVNLDPANAQTFEIINPLSGPLPSPPIVVTVPPMSMQQVAYGLGTAEAIIQNTTDSATRSNSWIAYGSTLDDTTGDAWSEIAVTGAPTLCCGPIW